MDESDFNDAEEEATEARNSRHLKIVDSHIAQLAEHFDTIQIFVTKREDDASTSALSRGIGNWYARYGQVQIWVVKEDETERDTCRNKDDKI